ncbi:MAG TPA: ATP-binding cassette domain-containing protein [Bacteroidales bacterium]|nr:ATP-binding cassette domain-containing protein [Bacteroidales bacterium]
MSEPILKALIQLFALMVDLHDDTVITVSEKKIVRSFLSRLLNNELVTRYMRMFDEFLQLYNAEHIEKGSIKDRKRISLKAMRILSICEEINNELHQKQKVYVLVQLMDFIASGKELTENKLDFIQTVANAFYIQDDEYRNIRGFILGTLYDVPEKRKLLFIDNKKESELDDVKHIFSNNLRGTISFLHIAATNTYILRYSGGEDLYLNGQNLIENQTYIFDHGSSIRGAGIDPVYYAEVAGIISGKENELRIVLEATDISFEFRNSENGIHHLDFHEESGKLVGILGGSGVGKSTTLSVLSGTLQPQSGKVLINGYNLYDEGEKENLKGVIGFVPQDDLLIEELTVFQNLYYNAKMCLDKFPESQIVEIVNKTLADLDLDEIKDLKVGNPLKKIISGGQRKRVNIALELLREPTILFVDEPTSGLSSVDSETVMNLLKEQTYMGKLVIINIHQPSSELYKMFDKVMIIDKGGYPIYYGNPTEAIVYFKTQSNHPNPDEDQCVKCGNINTDQILRIVEAKVVDEHGKATQIRKVTPVEWAEKFSKYAPSDKRKAASEKHKLPENNYSIPGLLKQSGIFFRRDVLSKLADKQYILISLLGPPLLAFILAYFTRFAEGSSYKFSQNENIPPYMFMCVITSMFFGLMISSEEIVKDRKILKRELFLNLSWFSYLNSKIMIMFILSAVQTISFVLIGNFILGIKGMTLSYWLVLFTTSCFANVLGLNISSAFNSVITIYILIPFIIIPQLLFSGVLVKFDKLHIGKYPTHEFVPVIGDLMTARWSFEALAVRQFKDNKFEKNFILYDIEKSQNNYYASFLINSLIKNIQQYDIYKDNPVRRNDIKEIFFKLNYHLDELSGLAGITPGSWKDSLNIQAFSPEVKAKTSAYLDRLKSLFNKKMIYARAMRDSVSKSIVESTGLDNYALLKDNYENIRLSDIVLDRPTVRASYETSYRIIQKYEPGFMKPKAKYGRAHFYAPVKNIGNREIDTYWFNLAVIWMVSILLYVILYYKVLQRLISYYGNLRIKSDEK